ncbi:hypothetical protein, partial [Sphingomonas sp. CCH15-F11]|uniref:hypothetical protein n=1 Tax=Sphingomonas sp. CCH15-F11 TaxID=1768785 RepID=UPI001E59A46A
MRAARRIAVLFAEIRGHCDRNLATAAHGSPPVIASAASTTAARSAITWIRFHGMKPARSGSRRFHAVEPDPG